MLVGHASALQVAGLFGGLRQARQHVRQTEGIVVAAEQFDQPLERLIAIRHFLGRAVQHALKAFVIAFRHRRADVADQLERGLKRAAIQQRIGDQVRWAMALGVDLENFHGQRDGRLKRAAGKIFRHQKFRFRTTLFDSGQSFE